MYDSLLPFIDVKDSLTRLADNKSLLGRLFTKFKCREMCDALIERMIVNDIAKIIDDAHMIKGVAANLGLRELERILQQIEAAAKANQETTSMIDTLNDAIEKTEESIQLFLDTL